MGVEATQILGIAHGIVPSAAPGSRLEAPRFPDEVRRRRHHLTRSKAGPDARLLLERRRRRERNPGFDLHYRASSLSGDGSGGIRGHGELDAVTCAICKGHSARNLKRACLHHSKRRGGRRRPRRAARCDQRDAEVRPTRRRGANSPRIRTVHERAEYLRGGEGLARVVSRDRPRLAAAAATIAPPIHGASLRLITFDNGWNRRRERPG